MRPVEKILRGWLAEMQKAFYDVSSQGVLVYQDPLIGALANSQKQIAVIAALDGGRLELRLRGRMEQVFEMCDGAAAACDAALLAYFKLFVSLCAGHAAVTKAA